MKCLLEAVGAVSVGRVGSSSSIKRMFSAFSSFIGAPSSDISGSIEDGCEAKGVGRGKEGEEGVGKNATFWQNSKSVSCPFSFSSLAGL